MKKFDLEERFIDYTINISDVVDKIDNSKLGIHIGRRINRNNL